MTDGPARERTFSGLRTGAVQLASCHNAAELSKKNGLVESVTAPVRIKMLSLLSSPCCGVCGSTLLIVALGLD